MADSTTSTTNSDMYISTFTPDINGTETADIQTILSQTQGAWSGADSTGSATGTSTSPLNAAVPVLIPPDQITASNATGQNIVNVPTASSPTAAEAEQYNQAMMADIAALVKQNNPNATAAQLTALTNAANYAAFNPDDPNVSSADKALVQTAQAQAQATVQKNNNDPSFTAPDGNTNTFQTYLDQVVANVFANYASTPPNTLANAQQLEFAYYHPNLVSASVLQELQQSGVGAQITAQLSAGGFATPAGWNPSSTDYDNMIAQNYDQNFEQNLSAYAQANNLSSTQVNELRAMHYSPELKVGDAATLAPILSQLESAALKTTQTSLNLPATTDSTWKPTFSGSDAVFANTLNIEYQNLNSQNLQTAIQAAVPPLTTDQQSELLEALSDSNLMSASPPTPMQALAQSIIKQSISKVQSDYNISTWAPTVSAVATDANPKLAGAATFLSQMQQQIIQLSQEIPDGPNKSSIVNLMNQIADALSQAQSQLYAIESAAALQQKNVQAAQNQENDVKIAAHTAALKQMQEQQAEIASKQAKASKMGTVFDVVGPIVMALAVAGSILSDQPELAIAVCVIMVGLMVADQADPSANVSQTVLSLDLNNNNWLTSIGIPADDASMIGNAIVIVAVATAIFASGGGAINQKTIGIIVSLTAQIMAQSGMLQTFLTNVCGMSQTNAMIVSASVLTVIGIVGGVGAAGGSSGATTAASGAEAGADAAKSTTSTLGKAVKTAIDEAKAVIQETSSQIRTIIDNAAEAGKMTSDDIIQMTKLALKNALNQLKLNALQNPALFINLFGKALGVAASGVEMKAAQQEVDIANITGEMLQTQAQSKASDANFQNLIDNLDIEIQSLIKMMENLQKQISGAADNITNLYKANTINYVTPASTQA